MYQLPLSREMMRSQLWLSGQCVDLLAVNAGAIACYRMKILIYEGHMDEMILVTVNNHRVTETLAGIELILSVSQKASN